MAIKKITLRNVGDMHVQDKDEYLWDSELKGFGIKATPTGAKIYIIQYRMGGRAAKTKRYTIGKHGSPWTPEKARKEAEEILAMVSKGIDPHQRKTEQTRKMLETDFEAVVRDFIEKYAKPRNRSWKEVERIFNHDIIPAFKGRSILSITRTDVINLLDDTAERGEVLANHVFSRLRKLFNWSVERGILEVSPIMGMRAPFKEDRRERVLNDAEISLIWNASDQLGWPFTPWFKLLLLTGQRRNEVAGMRWSDIDLKKKTWTIPSALAKNGIAHEVPLSTTAIAVLESVPKLHPKGLVFSTNGNTPISGFSRAKRRMDKAVKQSLEKAASKTRAIEPIETIPQWCWHDIRRTTATGIASLKFPPHIIEAVLNHKSGTVSGVAAVYNLFDYAEEKRAALDAWATKLSSVVLRKETLTKVVAIRRKTAP